MDNCLEYLRRNVVLASAGGAQASIDAALDRLAKLKRPPRWLVTQLEMAKVRADKLPTELAKWRDAASDNPYR